MTILQILPHSQDTLRALIEHSLAKDTSNLVTTSQILAYFITGVSLLMGGIIAIFRYLINTNKRDKEITNKIIGDINTTIGANTVAMTNLRTIFFVQKQELKEKNKACIIAHEGIAEQILEVKEKVEMHTEHIGEIKTQIGIIHEKIKRN